MKITFCNNSAFCILHSAFLPAFTLIELMVVMVVISILVGITIPISKYVSYRARMANQRIYIEKIKSALEDYRAAYGEYPITPSTNIISGKPVNYNDVLRHYPPSFDTRVFDTNSDFTSVALATNNVEWIMSDDGTTRGIDYALTYPLMLRQRVEGTRPLMDFKEITVAYFVYQSVQAGDVYEVKRRRKVRGGLVDEITKQGVFGKPVTRAKAIDPVSQRQWKYISDGVTYSLMTNAF